MYRRPNLRAVAEWGIGLKISYRLRRSTKQYILVSLICIVMIGGAAVFTAYVIARQIKDEYELLLAKAHQELSLNQRNVYVAATDIAAGDTITQDKVEKRKVFSSQPQKNFITSKEIGALALIDMPADTQIMYSMVTDPMISSELREVEYQVININSNINSNDTVDIRIFFQNGEDYVVLPKKVLRRYTEDMTSCFLWLTEEEIIRIRNAIVDAYLYTGAYLYTAKYIEPNIQQASIVTYTPSFEAIELIQGNPNIVDTATNDLSALVRKALENRLARALQKDITEQQWDINNDYIYQQHDGNKQGMSGQTEGKGSTEAGIPDEAFPAALKGKEETMGEIKGKEKEAISMQGETMIKKEAEEMEEEEEPTQEAIRKKNTERISDDKQEDPLYHEQLNSPDLGAINRYQENETGAEDYFMSTEG